MNANESFIDLSKLSIKQRAILEKRLDERRGKKNAATIEQAAPASGADEDNRVLATSVGGVEDLLAKFYGRFPWPWLPMKFDYLVDPDFETYALNQDVGDYTHGTVPLRPAIWVAGCGTNQAINTALKFPNATVVGSDISEKSLEICARNSRDLGLSNLELRRESINNASYDGQFDHVICTGVIHHNADPQISLSRLSAALKPGGIMEMMVYNRYHRSVTSAFQKAMRIFGENRDAIDFESDLAIARKVAASLPVKSLLEKGFIMYMDLSESDFADLLIQPVEHSYTVDSLEEIAEGCGLEMLYPCISMYAKWLASNSWNIDFGDAELQQAYDALPDTRRWQVTNLLLHEKSPLLWFYLQRKDSPNKRKPEGVVCEEFLDATFAKAHTTQRSFLRGEGDRYRPGHNSLPYPMISPDESVKAIYERVDGKTPMREIFEQLEIARTFQNVNNARIKLTTSAFPYCRAVSARVN
jgi:SAM-dependent methyltransferase